MKIRTTLLASALAFVTTAAFAASLGNQTVTPHNPFKRGSRNVAVIELKIAPGTFACIAQVFDAAHGPVTMVIAHPDGTVLIGHEVIKTNAIGGWGDLKLTNDPRDGGKIHVYVDDVLKGTYDSRGPRQYYFKCGVYSRKDSDRSEVWYRDVKEWERGM